MSDSEDDIPLARPVSKPTIPKSLDDAMASSSPAQTNGVAPGISMAMGPVTNGQNGRRKSAGKSYRESSSDEDDVPLTKKRKATAVDSDDDDKPLAKKITKPVRATAAQIGDDSDDDIPLGKKLQKEKAQIEKRADKVAKEINNKDKAAAQRRKSKADSDDDVPIAKKRKSITNGNGKARKEDSEDDRPLAKKTKKVKKEETTPAKRKTKAKEEEMEDADDDNQEEGYRWWEDPTKSDGTIKWTKLSHNGVVFPPEYEPLPKNAKMLYDGKPVSMHKDAEEIAYAFGSMLNSEHNVQNPVFQKNFFHDFTEALEKTGGATDRSGEKVKISKFEKCDFIKIFEYVDAERTAKKALPAAEKKRLKAEKDEKEAAYTYCLWDDRKQKVGNFRVEPPGLFRGRGEHPKTGHFKKRVLPEQITINIGKEAEVPKPPAGHKWKEIKHDQEGTWLAMWQENINGSYKYVMLAANSDIKGQSDHKKFEKARELKKHIGKIRQDYKKELKDKVMATRQRATAVYLIDQFALRAGNEKGEDEADTVGCCSLKFEHITLKPPNTVIFDFLGKDSIRFYNEVEVDQQVFKNLVIFKREPKQEGDEIFDRLTTSGLNKHLANYMPGLTAKVFRTYNASWTMANLLRDLKALGTVPEKVKAYNDANRMVAILCNHKRTVGATHAQQMEKMEDKINAMAFQQWRIKQMILDIEPKLKKKRGSEYFDLPSDLNAEWVAEHYKALVDAERTKITKKFEKENEKLQAEDSKPMKQSELDQRLTVLKELEAKYKKELKTSKVEAEGKGPTVEKYEAQIARLDERINAAKLQSEDRESNKEVALGTSKINYIDPRLTVVFSKKFNVPIERFFSKTLREKFDWAIQSVDEKWEF